MNDRDRTPPVAPPPRATWREWVGLALLTLPMLALATDLSVLFVAMPSLSADLQPNTSQMLWILHIYGFLIGGLLITMGRLGDRIGRRRLLMTGAAAFAVLSMAAAWSTSAEMLIAVRALLGVAGATLMPSTYSLLRNLFLDDGQRRYAIAAMFATFAVGSAIGPLLGGALLAVAWWGAVFLVNLPPLLLLLTLGRRFLPEHRDEATARLDLPSVGLSIGALVTTIYGLQEAAEHGLRPLHAIAVVAGVTMGVTFLRRQRRLADPLLDLALFRERRFSASLGMVFFAAVGGVGAFYLFSQYLQWTLGMSPLRAGLWTAPYVVSSGLGMMLGPVLMRWLRQSQVIGLGLGVGAVGMAAMAVATGSSFAVLITVMSLTAVGSGAAMALGSDLIISTAPAERAGSAAAMQEVSGEVGTALGIAVGGGVGMFAYRRSVTERLPSDAPAEMVVAAEHNVASGLLQAQELSATADDRFLVAVQDAFTTAVQVSFGMGATVIAVVGVVAFSVLRHTDATSDDTPSDDTPGTETPGSAATGRDAMSTDRRPDPTSGSGAGHADLPTG